VAARKDFQVALSRSGPAQEARGVLAGIGRRARRSLAWREGSKGWLRARFTALHDFDQREQIDQCHPLVV
jgi:hypothetical protein